MSVLVCENVCKYKKNQEIIHNFSYNFLDNQIYAIIGNNTKRQNDLLKVIFSISDSSPVQIFSRTFDPFSCYLF